MNRFKPYTIGLATSILFHLPFIYFFCQIAPLPNCEPPLLIDPILVHCSFEPPQPTYRSTSLKPPPMSLPPDV